MLIDLIGLGNRIRTIRNERHLTQEQLAVYTGLSTHYIGNIEQGVRSPSIGSVFLLCRALGATPDQLFEDSITESMRSGRCERVEDQYALREVSDLDYGGPTLGELILAREDPDAYEYLLSPALRATRLDGDRPAPTFSFADSLEAFLKNKQQNGESSK